MSDIPIIFSAPMVRALLDGRKTMTRRLAYKPWVEVDDLSSEQQEDYEIRGRIFHHRSDGSIRAWAAPTPWQKVKPGDRLWVRETWLAAADGCWSVSDVMRWRGFVRMDMRYAADGVEGPFYPSIHMPRWASRLTLVVTGTKIEHLQSISEDDATAEGAGTLYPETFRGGNEVSNSRRFQMLWRDLHGLDSWCENPQVVALTFTVHKCNIDQLTGAASEQITACPTCGGSPGGDHCDWCPQG